MSFGPSSKYQIPEAEIRISEQSDCIRCRLGVGKICNFCIAEPIFSLCPHSMSTLCNPVSLDKGLIPTESVWSYVPVHAPL
jgi:hypothetical protein